MPVVTAGCLLEESRLSWTTPPGYSRVLGSQAELRGRSGVRCISSSTELMRLQPNCTAGFLLNSWTLKCNLTKGVLANKQRRSFSPSLYSVFPSNSTRPPPPRRSSFYLPRQVNLSEKLFLSGNPQSRQPPTGVISGA